MGEEATIAAPTAQAPQQRRPLRERCWMAASSANRTAAPPASSAFLHGKLGFGEALEAWFGEAVTSLLAAGGDRLRAASTATSPTSTPPWAINSTPCSIIRASGRWKDAGAASPG